MQLVLFWRSRFVMRQQASAEALTCAWLYKLVHFFFKSPCSSRTFAASIRQLISCADVAGNLNEVPFAIAESELCKQTQVALAVDHQCSHVRQDFQREVNDA